MIELDADETACRWGFVSNRDDPTSGYQTPVAIARARRIWGLPEVIED